MYRFIVILAVITFVHGYSRIIGGNDANIKDHNYQVSVQYYNQHFCGGALVKSNIVLTMASLLSSKKHRLSVRAGSSVWDQGGEVLSVVKFIKHPQFPSDPSRDYNVALLVLNGFFQLKQEIGIITLAPKGISIKAGTIGTVTGWGGTKPSEINTKHLQSVQVPHVSWSSCKTKQIILHETLSCWGYLDGQKDVCSKDHGGPLVIQDETKNVVLAAMVSFDYHCGNGPYPRMYTDVTHHEIHDFISQYILEN